MRTSISRSMIVIVLSISLLVALCSAVYEIRADYLAAMRAVERDLNLIESTHIPAMTAAVWSLDPVQIGKQMAGIAKLPDISYVVLRGKFPFDIEPWGKPAGADQQHSRWPVIRRSYVLVHRDDPHASGEVIGRLEVEASLQGLYLHLRATALTIVLTEFARSLILAAVIIVAMRWLLLRHLTDVVVYTSKLTLDGLDDELRLSCRHKPRGDELDTLVASINAMRVSLRDAVRKRQAAEVANRQLAVDKEAVELASAAKREFFSQISHEIRTPMNAIIGMSHLLLRSSSPQAVHRYAQKIRRAALSLLGIIDDILDMSKLEAGRMELDHVAFDLYDFIDGVVDMIGQSAADKGLELIVEAAADLPERVVGDPLRLRQIVLNLMANAVRFTASGFVLLGLKILARNATQVILRISVRDTGIGMTGGQIQRIFTPYRQADRSVARRFGGTGLGLSLSQRLAALMGSHIDVDSRVEEGSAFAFDLTLDLADADNSATTAAAMFAPCRVLVIDDCAEARRVEIDLLGRLGVDAYGLASPDQLSLTAPIDAFPDVVLVDWDVAVTAPSLLVEPLRDALPTSRLVLMVPTFAREQAESAIAVAGLDSNCVLLDKPVMAPALRALLSRLADGQAPPDALTRSSDGTAPNSGKLVSASLFNVAPANETSVSDVLGGTHWLLVEDNPVNQELTVSLLALVGAKTSIAGSGEEALALLTEQRFSGVLMDEMLPGMDGSETTQAIRQRLQLRLPVIGMSASGSAAGRERAVAAGMDDFVEKPVDPTALYATLAKWAHAAARQ